MTTTRITANSSIELPPAIDWEKIRGVEQRYIDPDTHGPRSPKTPIEAEANGRQYPASAPEPWPVMGDAAYHGVTGEFVRAIEPHTEADPVALLIQFLTVFGSIVGPSPYFRVENDRHRANLFAVLIGNSSRGRKGTSAGHVRAVSEIADANWLTDRNASGLSSGEGLISHVRDQVVRWNADEQCDKIIDPGVSDKRLLITESEFAGTLAVMERPGNTLSPVIRNAWDGLPLQTMTKNSPLKATGAYISIVAHITKDELRARMTRTDMANGFANRFLFALVRRSKELPFGGHLNDAALIDLANKLTAVVAAARTVTSVRMTDAAITVWAAAYSDLSADRPGMLGAVTARAEAQTTRLALIYALLDGKGDIDLQHLEAAMAVWGYCDQSAQIIFGDSLGNPLADEILSALHRNPLGMTRTDIRDLFQRNRSSDEISGALAVLLQAGRAKYEIRQTGGRPVETWFAMTANGRATT